MKIKRIIALLIINLALISAQGQNNSYLAPTYKTFIMKTLPFLKSDVLINEKMEKFFNLPPNESLNEIKRVESLGIKHITLQHFVGEYKVEFSLVKLHIYKDNSVFIQSFIQQESKIKSTSERHNIYLPTPLGLVSVSKRVNNEIKFPKIEYVDINGNILLAKDYYRYIKKDSFAHARIFSVNPINSSATKYGQLFSDNGDQNSPELESEQFWVKIPTKEESGRFYLESNYLFFGNISYPNDNSNYSQLGDTFDFDRSDQNFEAVNTYYHINKMGEYVDGLGFDALTNKIKVDVHAFSGDDNSAYDPTDHTLQFGEGGVDDAEDGEVVIHEYVHSLSETASENTTVGNQREAMEEGICDYMSKAYSLTFNDNTSNQVFSWDGFNEFWGGIDINTNRKYPQDLRNFKDGDRDMWSSALMCVHDFIGREATDSLVLEHLYYQGPNTTMPQMAQALITVDSMQSLSRYYSSIKTCMVEAGFMSYGASLPLLDNSIFVIKNSSAFRNGRGNLLIDIPKMDVQWTLYNELGDVIKTGTSNSRIEFAPSDLAKGVYVLSLEVQHRLSNYKILR